MHLKKKKNTCTLQTGEDKVKSTDSSTRKHFAKLPFEAGTMQGQGNNECVLGSQVMVWTNIPAQQVGTTPTHRTDPKRLPRSLSQSKEIQFRHPQSAGKILYPIGVCCPASAAELAIKSVCLILFHLPTVPKRR